MSYAEHALETTIRQLRLPVDERKIRLRQWWEKLEAVESSLENGHLHEITNNLLQKTRKFTTVDLINHLKSENVRNNVLKWRRSALQDEQQQLFDGRKVSEFLQDRITDEIANFGGYKNLREWVNSKFVEDAQKAQKTLNILNLDVTGGNTSEKEISVTSDDDVNEDDDDDDVDDHDDVVVRSAKKLKIAAVVAATPLLVAAVPLALLIGVIATPVVATLKKIKERSFKEAVAKAFDDFLTQCQTESGVKNLHNLVLTVLEHSCYSVKFVRNDIPEQIATTRQRLRALEQQDEVHVPKYKELLCRCQEQSGKLSKFALQFYPHRYTYSDLTWDQTSEPIGTCSFGTIYKVTLPKMKKAALKLSDDHITPEKALDIKRELTNSRY